MSDYEYVNTRRVVYGEGATFIPVCEKCGRYVKAPATVLISEGNGLKDVPNAECSKCGPTKMIFEGFI